MSHRRQFHASMGVSLFLFMLFGCGSNRPPKEFDSAASSVEYLIKAGRVDSDTEFKKQLVGCGQRDDHAAPQSLRTLLHGEEIVRGTFSQGVVHENGTISLYWHINNCGIVGEEADVRKRLFDAFDAMGFERFPSPDKQYQLGYRRELAGIEETVLLNEPDGWTGGRRAVAGVEFLWTLRSTSTAPMFTYPEIKQIMPVFYDKRIDETVYGMFQDAKLVRVEIGGTWTKYYSLRVDIARLANHEGSTDTLHQQIVDRLEEAGFTQTEKPKYSTWDMYHSDKSRHSVSNIQLKIDKDLSCVCLSIQPE